MANRSPKPKNTNESPPDIYIFNPILSSSMKSNNVAVGRHHVAVIAVLCLSVIFLASYSRCGPNSSLKLVSVDSFPSPQVKTSQQVQASVNRSMNPASRAESQSDKQTSIRPQLSETSVSFMEAFQSTKHSVQSVQSDAETPKSKTEYVQKYKTCLQNFTALSGPVVETYPQMDVTEQRQIAEAFWLQQKGKLWMQHTRKGGGTSLCMSLRLNQQGLIKNSAGQWDMPKRETCQLQRFCSDCDLTGRKPSKHRALAWQGWDKAARLVDCVTNIHHRNFLELEDTVSPPNILTHPEWANYVFISTLRHPIARIISSLKNEGRGHGVIATDALIHEACHGRNYWCYANYYVRMFAGLSTSNHEVTRKHLQAAKNNFKRYSCVILQEEWGSTETCLSSKLGLHLTTASGFNVGGAIKQEAKETVAVGERPPPTFLDFLDQVEVDRLMAANGLDLEFYEWAKELILSGYFTGY